MELFLIGTITFYFAALLKITDTVLPWFLLAVLVGIISVYLWQFVLWRYNPVRLLRHSIAAYYRLTSMTISEIIRTLQKTPPPPGWEKRLERSLLRIARCRKVIESEFAAVLSPPVWIQARLDRLRIDFYNAEQGISLMVAAISTLVGKSEQIPADLYQTLLKTLADLQVVVAQVASPASVENLEKQSNILRESINSRTRDNPAGAWGLSLIRTIAGGVQLNRAVKDARDIESDRGSLIPFEPVKAAKPVAAAAKNPAVTYSGIQTPTVLQKLQLKTLHVTTILGLQASLAALLAMLIAYFLSLDHSNWVFWTAFVVIAGSTGESLRRMSFRVIGTVAGVLAGVALSIILTNLNAGSAPVIGLVAAFLFLAAYYVDTSYTWMIIWINMAVSLLFISLGGGIGNMLVIRPLYTFIGAAIAALVVVFVLPVRTGERFGRSLVIFLNSMDQYIAGFTARITGQPTALNLDAATIQLSTAFSRLAQTFPSLALEYNPLARAQSPLLEKSTVLQSLNKDLVHINQDLSAGFAQKIRAETADLINAIRERTHSNIVALIGLLTGKPTGEVRPLADLFAQANQTDLLEQLLKPKVDEDPSSETHFLVYLARINQALSQLVPGNDTG